MLGCSENRESARQLASRREHPVFAALVSPAEKEKRQPEICLLTQARQLRITVSCLFNVPLLEKSSMRRGAFIRGERLIQSSHLRGPFIGYEVFI